MIALTLRVGLADFIVPGSTNDYLGMGVILTDDRLYLSMESYIDNAIDILELHDHRKASTPISSPIDTETAPLPPWKVKRFLTALGMLGWLASTVRLDVAYAFSRIAQHCATPTESALNTVYKAFAYLRDTHHT